MQIKKEPFNCEIHGEVIITRMYRDNKDGHYFSPNGEPTCHHCVEEKEKARWQKKEALRITKLEEDRAKKLLDDLHVPGRYENATFNNYTAVNAGQKSALKACRNYAENFSELSKAGGGLLLVGGVGTGKTHLAIAIGKELVENKHSARYANLADVIRAVRSSWNSSEYDEADVYNTSSSFELLILDEVGVQAGTDNERNIIFEVINTRYGGNKPTILISNLPEREMMVFVGERVIDRIKDGRAGTIVFNWQSYRQRAA